MSRGYTRSAGFGAREGVKLSKEELVSQWVKAKNDLLAAFRVGRISDQNNAQDALDRANLALAKFRAGGVFEQQDKAANEYYDKKVGFGAAEDAVAAQPKHFSNEDLPSFKQPSGKKMDGAMADGKFILMKHPDYKDARKVANAFKSGNETADAKEAAAALEKADPNFYGWMTKATYDTAVGRSIDAKVRFASASRDAKLGPTVNAAWKAASDAFKVGDEAGKMMFKTGEDSYKDTREWVGPKSRVNLSEMTSKTLPEGAPALYGRVAAVNLGINSAINAATRVIERDKNLNESQKAFIRSAIYDRMVSDKHAFLVVKGYIDKTSLYEGPESSKGVSRLAVNGDWV